MSGSPSTKNSAPILALENVTLRAGAQTAFPRTNWAIQAGEQWAILGPNNSGKSILAAALAAEVLPVRGEVNCSLEVEQPSPFQNPVALVSPQTHRAVATAESSFYQSRWHSGLGEGRFTVSHFLSQEHIEEINPYEVNPRRTPRPAYLARRRAGIRLLRLEPLLRRKLICLSNGEMRRVLLARALLLAPRLLVLDEPFAGLDPATRGQLRGVIPALMRDGMQVFVVTSRPDEIPNQTTHLLLVNRHRVVAQGAKADLLGHPLVKQLRAKPRAAGAPAAQRAAQPVRSSRHAAAAPLVEIKDATIRFGAKRILSHITWTIRPGEHWALLGPNGSGKTTLLSLIQGDNPQAYAQDIRLFGISPDSTQALWHARRHIGWLSPELHLHYPLDWNCHDVVCSGFFDSIGLFEPCTARQRSQAKRWLRQLGFAHRAQTPLGELSAGEQRLILLARALVKRPRLLVLDEPCQALDRAHRQLILATVERIVAATDASLVFVTHHHRELPACINRLFKLQAGRTVYQGPWPSPSRSLERAS